MWNIRGHWGREDSTSQHFLPSLPKMAEEEFEEMHLYLRDPEA